MKYSNKDAEIYYSYKAILPKSSVKIINKKGIVLGKVFPNLKEAEKVIKYDEIIIDAASRTFLFSGEEALMAHFSRKNNGLFNVTYSSIVSCNK